MVGSVNRHVHGRAYPIYVGLYLIGGIIGGVAAVMLVRAVGASVAVTCHSVTVTAVAMTVAALAILSDHQLIPLRVPSTNQQVPAGWRHTMPSAIWVPGFGVILGFTFLTKFASAVVPAALVAIGLMADGIPTALVGGAVYGGARGFTVMAAPLRRADASDLCAGFNQSWIGTLGIALVLVAVVSP